MARPKLDKVVWESSARYKKTAQGVNRATRKKGNKGSSYKPYRGQGR